MSCVLHYVFISSLLKQQVSPLILIRYSSPNFFSVCAGTRKYQPVAEKYTEVLLTKIPDNQKKNHHSASRRKKSNYTPYMHCIIAPNYVWKLFKYATGHGPTSQRRPCHKWAAPSPMNSHWHQAQPAAPWGGWEKGIQEEIVTIYLPRSARWLMVLTHWIFCEAICIQKCFRN